MKLSKQQLSFLWFAFIMVSLVVVVQNVTLILYSDPTATGYSTQDVGTVDLCVKRMPYWLNPIDCGVALTGAEFACDVSAIDPDGGTLVYDATLLSGNTNGSDFFRNITANGTLQGLPQINQLGNYTVQFSAVSPGTCQVYAYTTANFTILEAQNAPVLIAPIPDSEWAAQTLLVPYNLHDYFVDPDGNPMAFRAEGNVQIRITINANGEVTLDPEPGFCGEEIVNYIATDTTNLSATSNDVTLEVECPEPPGQSSGGGGGGGGGGVLNPRQCSQDKFCYDWTSCQYTVAVTEAGSRHEIIIEGVGGERTYTIDGNFSSEIDIFYEGYQYRECIDLNQCVERKSYLVRSCEYQPSCSDGIKNQNELDVDCGGVCKPCGTCSDGIQNGHEEGVDCGGPNCDSCYSCSDGILNGFELAVDCGGPDCSPCRSCFDGIQNQGETGVDCGGPCSACVERQEPTTVVEAVTWTLLGLILIAIVTIVFMFVAQRWVRSMLAALALNYKHTNRMILLSRQQRDQLLHELDSIYNTIGSGDPMQVQDSLGRVMRSYFVQALHTPYEATSAEIPALLASANLHQIVLNLLGSLFSRGEAIEFSQRPVSETVLLAFALHLRHTIWLTSAYNSRDLREQIRSASRRQLPQVRADADDWVRARALIIQGAEGLVRDDMLLVETSYTNLHGLYTGADSRLQEWLYPEVDGFYRLLALAQHIENSFWLRRS